MARDRESNSAGFSLVAVLVAIGLTSIVFSALADLLTLNARAQRTTMMKGEFEYLVATLRGAVATETTCAAALGGNSQLGAVTVRDPIVPARSLAAPGLLHPAGWTFTRVALEQSTSVPGHGNLMRAQLRIEAKKNGRLTLGGDQLARSIADVYYQLGDSESTQGQIVRCFTDPGLLTADVDCMRLGGTWIQANKPGAQCIIFGQRGALQ